MGRTYGLTENTGVNYFIGEFNDAVEAWIINTPLGSRHSSSINTIVVP
jgi:hypothetical protein